MNFAKSELHDVTHHNFYGVNDYQLKMKILINVRTITSDVIVR